jgi:hypothetical protein
LVALLLNPEAVCLYAAHATAPESTTAVKVTVSAHPRTRWAR